MQRDRERKWLGCLGNLPDNSTSFQRRFIFIHIYVSQILKYIYHEIFSSAHFSIGRSSFKAVTHGARNSSEKLFVCCVFCLLFWDKLTFLQANVQCSCLKSGLWPFDVMNHCVLLISTWFHIRAKGNIILLHSSHLRNFISTKICKT